MIQALEQRLLLALGPVCILAYLVLLKLIAMNLL